MSREPVPFSTGAPRPACAATVVNQARFQAGIRTHRARLPRGEISAVRCAGNVVSNSHFELLNPDTVGIPVFCVHNPVDITHVSAARQSEIINHKSKMRIAGGR